jgi:ankyrin repeat protein
MVRHEPMTGQETMDDERDLEAFRNAVGAGDVPAVRRLLASTAVRDQINAPMFAFGQRAIHIAAKRPALLEELIAAGADLHLKSDWANGPYTVLDLADEESARFLLARGAVLTANAAARLGWFDELTRLVTADPSLVHARGGDGQQPLHEAKNVAIADFLLDQGADINARCIDHKSTPAQYALVERLDVCRRLLQRGAAPDVFMAARIGDVALAVRILDDDPSAAEARIHDPGYAPVPPLHIYCWTLGFGMSPHDVALKFGHRDVYELLVARSSGRVRLLVALMAGDEATARALIDADNSLLPSLTASDHGRLAQAILHGQHAAAHLMLRLGFDETAPGIDGGTSLHAACWVGDVSLVDAILERGRVPVDARDPTHLSTPLGWTAHGSVHRRARGADYVGVVDRLVVAGADVTAPGNRSNATLVSMAEGNRAVQDALRRHGAVS